MHDMFEAVRDLYDTAIMDRGRAPRHAGRPDAFDATARSDNPMCGDRVDVFVSLDPAGAVRDTRFVARGCAVCIASADLMTEAVAGRSPDAVRSLAAEVTTMARTGAYPDYPGDPTVAALQPLSAVHTYPSRITCVTLPWSALVSALDSVPAGQETGRE
jgi:nitrogen fixation NifU-like protein